MRLLDSARRPYVAVVERLLAWFGLLRLCSVQDAHHETLEDLDERLLKGDETKHEEFQ